MPAGTEGRGGQRVGQYPNVAYVFDVSYRIPYPLRTRKNHNKLHIFDNSGLALGSVLLTIYNNTRDFVWISLLLSYSYYIVSEQNCRTHYGTLFVCTS